MAYSLCCAMGEAEWTCRKCRETFCAPCCMDKATGKWLALCPKCNRSSWRIFCGGDHFRYIKQRLANPGR